MSYVSEKNDRPGNVITLDIVERRRKRRLYFASEEDKKGWEKAYRKSKLFIPYFLVGIGINFILYLSGLDLSKNLLLGGLVGMLVPMAAMFLLSELHYRIFYENSTDAAGPGRLKAGAGASRKNRPGR
ncbi:MAG: hypothetical protein K6T29_08720 [Peptococcaceae bacterium]|nr:hypothetical protein [Peptococcaceae bacterium]